MSSPIKSPAPAAQLEIPENAHLSPGNSRKKWLLLETIILSLID
jgi:hypothetical protein